MSTHKIEHGTIILTQCPPLLMRLSYIGWWSEDSAGARSLDLTWCSVWRATCKDFLWEMNVFMCQYEGFQVSIMAEDSVSSQNMDLKWCSVWRAKCKDFHRKMKVFRCQ